MSALGFLGGLAGAYTAIDRGMQVAKEREQADEDRAFVKSQRGLQQQQQQRQLDEQKRADKLREDLVAIPSVERVDVDLNKASPETSQITIDNEGGPSATQVPAIKTIERPRGRDAQLRDAAGAYRRSGDLGRAFELEGAADKEMFNRSARQFAQLKAGSANMSAAEIARQAKSIFDNDPFPMQVAAIREGADGSVAVDIRNRDTGAMQTWNAKNKNELLSGIESYYSHDSYQALQRARSEAAAKAEEARLAELYKPYTLRPGERREVVDPSTGKVMLLDRGEIPPNSELVTDANGNLVLRRTDGSSSSRSANKAEAPPDRAADAFDTVLKNSPLKDALPEQISRGRALARQFALQGNVDPAVAADAAVLAVSKQGAVRPTFDDKTGRIVDAIEYKGGNFIVEDRGGIAAPRGVAPEVMKSIAAEYVARLPADGRSLFVAAAFNPQARAALDERVRQSTIAAMREALGREPTPEQIATQVPRALARTGAALDLIGNHLDRGAISSGVSGSGFTLGRDGKVVPASQPSAQSAARPGAAQPGAAAAPAQSAIPAVGGLGPRVDPLERNRALQEAARARLEAERADAARVASEKARQLLQSGDIKALMDFQNSSSFAALDRATKAEIYKKVNSIR